VRLLTRDESFIEEETGGVSHKQSSNEAEMGCWLRHEEEVRDWLHGNKVIMHSRPWNDDDGQRVHMCVV